VTFGEADSYRLIALPTSSTASPIFLLAFPYSSLAFGFFVDAFLVKVGVVREVACGLFSFALDLVDLPLNFVLIHDLLLCGGSAVAKPTCQAASLTPRGACG
jgi:hypothetical protein